MDWIEIIKSGWIGNIFGLIGTITGITGCVLAYIFYRNNRIGPRIKCQCVSKNIANLTDKILPTKVKIQFDNETIECLTKTHLIIWNSGMSMADGSIISKNDPLRIVFKEDIKILYIMIKETTRPINNFTCSNLAINPNILYVNFDHLNMNDGALVEILHTDEKPKMTLKGTLRGYPKAIINTINEFDNSRKDMIIAPIVFMPLSFMILFQEYPEISLFEGLLSLSIFVLGIIFVIRWYHYLRHFPKPLMSNDIK